MSPGHHADPPEASSRLFPGLPQPPAPRWCSDMSRVPVSVCHSRGRLGEGGDYGGRAGRNETHVSTCHSRTLSKVMITHTYTTHTLYLSLFYRIYTIYTPHAHIRVLLVFVTRNTRASTLATYAYTRESIRVFTTKHFFSLPRALARDKQNRGEKLLTRYLGCDLDATLFNVR